MSSALFIGRKTTFKRGGRLVFESLYQEYGQNKVLIEVDSSNFSIIRSLFSELISLKDVLGSRKANIDIIIIQHNDIREIILALLAKVIHKDAVLVGPLYHFENSSINFFKIPFKKILAKFNQKLSFLIYLSKFKIVLTEDESIKIMLKKIAPQIKVIVERFGASGRILSDQVKTNEERCKSIDLLYLGAIDSSKGIWDFLDALCEINQTDLSICISGFGTRTMIDEVTTYLKDKELKSVTFKPNVNDAEKYNLLISSKVLVVPSFFEGIPITFQEAMITKCLVLAYYLPSYAYFSQNIFTVPPHNVKELEEQMLNLSNNYEKYDLMIEKNFQFATTNTSEIVARRVIKKIVDLKVNFPKY